MAVAAARQGSCSSGPGLQGGGGGGGSLVVSPRRCRWPWVCDPPGGGLNGWLGSRMAVGEKRWGCGVGSWPQGRLGHGGSRLWHVGGGKEATRGRRELALWMVIHAPILCSMRQLLALQEASPAGGTLIPWAGGVPSGRPSCSPSCQATCSRAVLKACTANLRRPSRRQARLLHPPQHRHCRLGAQLKRRERSLLQLCSSAGPLLRNGRTGPSSGEATSFGPPGPSATVQPSRRQPSSSRETCSHGL